MAKSYGASLRAIFRISLKVPVLPKPDGSFEVVNEKTKGAQRPSELNHGNIVFESTNGGVRCRFAEQTTVVSLGALRTMIANAAGIVVALGALARFKPQMVVATGGYVCFPVVVAAGSRDFGPFALGWLLLAPV